MSALQLELTIMKLFSGGVLKSQLSNRMTSPVTVGAKLNATPCDIGEDAIGEFELFGDELPLRVAMFFALSFCKTVTIRSSTSSNC